MEKWKYGGHEDMRSEIRLHFLALPSSQPEIGEHGKTIKYCAVAFLDQRVNLL